MSFLAFLIRLFVVVIRGWHPAPAGAVAFPGPASDRSTGDGSLRGRDPLRHANAGGPRSRVVSTAVVSRVLSDGSETLGLKTLGKYHLPRQPAANQLREFVFALLQRAGFRTPEEAWEAQAAELPGAVALVVDTPPGPDRDDARDHSLTLLHNALVLGKCCGSLFSPGRPLIWSERRLARSVRLVHCESATFAGNDDD